MRYSIRLGLTALLTAAVAATTAIPGQAASTAPGPFSCGKPISVRWATGQQRTGAQSTQSLATAAFAQTYRKLVTVSPAAATASTTLVITGVPGMTGAPRIQKLGNQYVLQIGSGVAKPATTSQIAAVINSVQGACTVTRTAMPTPTPGNSAASRALRSGVPYVGLRFVFGGTSLTTGVDCSAFARANYAKAGKSLPRTAAEQRAATLRTRSPKPGDLVFFTNGGHTHHVGLYVSPGWMLDAPGTGRYVRFSQFGGAGAKYYPGDVVSYGVVR